MKVHLLQGELIGLPVAAAQLHRLVQANVQQICRQRLQTQAIIHFSLPEMQQKTLKLPQQSRKLVQLALKQTVLLSQGQVSQINRARERQAAVARQAFAIFVAADSDFKKARVSEELH